MCTWNNQDCIVTVDYYSRLFELDRFHGITSTAVIHKLKAAFARHGIAETVVSDNGQQYKSGEFKVFAKLWEFKHITSSPHFPQSNGLAEKTVHTAKLLMDKAKADGRDPYASGQFQVTSPAAAEPQTMIYPSDHQPTATDSHRQSTRGTGKTDSKTTTPEALP